MTPRIMVLRILSRVFLASLLTVGLVLALWIFVEELNDADNNEALTALLGAVVAYLGAALKDVVTAIATNPTDRKPVAADDE